MSAYLVVCIDVAAGSQSLAHELSVSSGLCCAGLHCKQLDEPVSSTCRRRMKRQWNQNKASSARASPGLQGCCAFGPVGAWAAVRFCETAGAAPSIHCIHPHGSHPSVHPPARPVLPFPVPEGASCTWYFGTVKVSIARLSSILAPRARAPGSPSSVLLLPVPSHPSRPSSTFSPRPSCRRA